MIHVLFLFIGGHICYASCLAVVGGGSFIAGAAILPLLGFTSSGISAASWAASWMASYAGSIPQRCRYAHLQAAGAAAISWSAFDFISGFCSASCALLP